MTNIEAEFSSHKELVAFCRANGVAKISFNGVCIEFFENKPADTTPKKVVFNATEVLSSLSTEPLGERMPTDDELLLHSTPFATDATAQGDKD